MSEKPILVFVFSTACGHCTQFKEEILPGLLKELPSGLDYEIVEFPEFNIPNTGTLETESGTLTFHPKLNSKVIGFPSLLLMPRSMWTNKKSNFSPQVYDSSSGISKSKILKWINESIANSGPQTDWSKYKKLPDGRYLVPTRGQFGV